MSTDRWDMQKIKIKKIKGIDYSSIFWTTFIYFCKIKSRSSCIQYFNSILYYVLNTLETSSIGRFLAKK